MNPGHLGSRLNPLGESIHCIPKNLSAMILFFLNLAMLDPECWWKQVAVQVRWDDPFAGKAIQLIQFGKVSKFNRRSQSHFGCIDVGKDFCQPMGS